MQAQPATASHRHTRHRASHLALALALVVSVAVAVLGPSQQVEAALLTWNATVTQVLDGDTFEARLDGQSGVITVRVAGLQTNEVTTNECYSEEATDRFRALLDGERVVLRARSANSKSLGRPIRHVFLNGENMAIKMLREGWGVPVSFNEEPDFRVEYTNAALKAAGDEIGVWDDDICGVGPAQNAVIDMVTNYDAAHDDSTNINGEYVQLRNRGAQTISFDGWQIRDSALRRFPLPNGVRLEPGGRLRIFVGRGTNTATSIFLNQDFSIFGNEADGAFLYDSDFDIRAWDMWPCSETCELPEPLIIEHVNYDAPGDDNTNPNGEWIRIRNIGQTTVDLQDWMIEIPRAQLTSIASRPIPPGGAVTFYIGAGVNTQTEMYFGLSGGMLSNSNHLVTLYSPDRIVSSCDARGNRTCPPPINGGHPMPRPLPPGVTLRVPVTGVAGVPSSGVKGVSLNVTAVNPVDRGWLRVWPCGSSEPGTASLNYVAGGVAPNAMVMPVDATGEVCVSSRVATDVVVDLTGWFDDAVRNSSLTRVVDTRYAIGPIPDAG